MLQASLAECAKLMLAIVNLSKPVIAQVHGVATAAGCRLAAMRMLLTGELIDAQTAIGKQAFYRQAELPLADAHRYAAEVMASNLSKRDAQEGIDALIEKRSPVRRAE
jgi:enoyl-CoA hydratase/carnithine racemase